MVEQYYGNGRVGAFAGQAQSFTKGSVGLSSIQIWGQKVDFHEGVVNNAMPLYDDPLRRRAVDELLISQGMLDGLEEFTF